MPWVHCPRILPLARPSGQNIKLKLASLIILFVDFGTIPISSPRGLNKRFKFKRFVLKKKISILVSSRVGQTAGDLSPSLGLKFTDVPNGFAAFSKVPLSGWAQMVAFAGTVELFQYVDDPKRALLGVRHMEMYHRASNVATNLYCNCVNIV